VARNLDPKCRQCRREGEKLFLKGEKCFTDKCAIERRSYAPGQHGQKSGARLSDYGVHLRAKQKIRRVYGVLEGQFRKTFASKLSAARARPVKTCCNCWKPVWIPSPTAWVLAPRVPNPVRSFVTTASWSTASASTSRPYIVKPGDVVQLTDRARASLRCKAALEAAESRGFPEWISVDVKEGKGTFKAMPQRSELPATLNEGLVIELYSK
jgi:small subunit ribosomal protein S4